MAEAEIKQQGSSLPKGAATQLDEGFDEAAAAPEALPVDSTVDQSEVPEVFGESGPDEIDAEIFAPSDFPNRPLTNGLPFGPGQNFTVTPRMTDRALLTRAALSIAEAKDSVPTGAVEWAMRVLLEGA